MMGYWATALQRVMGTSAVLVRGQRAAGSFHALPALYGTGWLRLFDTADARRLSARYPGAFCAACALPELFAMEKQTKAWRVVCAAPLGAQLHGEVQAARRRAGLRRAGGAGRVAALLGGPAGLRRLSARSRRCTACPPSRHAGLPLILLILLMPGRAHAACAS